MPDSSTHPVLRFLHRFAGPPPDTDGDRQLLERFAAWRDEAAFTALVQRHGPLVLGVCRRLLPNEQDAEDAFQATFLVLARKAGAIRVHDSAAGWLYGVAYRVAKKAQVRAARRTAREREVLPMPPADPLQEIAWRDLRPVLDEEIERLPEKYRLAFLLCYLQGRTNEEAARLLRCPVGTVVSRLARARQRLRDRLARRGLAIAAGALAAFATSEARAAVPAARLAHSTVQAALAFGAGTAASVPASAAVLAEGVLRTMFVKKLLSVGSAVLLAGLIGTGVVWMELRARADKEVRRIVIPEGGKVEVVAGVDQARHQAPSQRDGLLQFVGTEIEAGENVPPELLVKVKIGGEEKSFRRLRVGDRVEAGQLLGRIDDRLARKEGAIRVAGLQAAEADQQAAEKTLEEAEQRYKSIMKLRTAGSAQDEEVRGAKLTRDRYEAEVLSKRAAVAEAKARLEQAEIMLEQHEIRSGAGGVVTSILKKPGEAVRAFEPVVEIKIKE